MKFPYILYVSYVDFIGFITAIWTAKSKNGNEYINIKLKTDVDQYPSIRIMKSHNPAINEDSLKSLQIGAIPSKFCKVFTTSGGTNFFNAFRGSRIEEGVSVPFKVNDNLEHKIKELKKKSA